MIHQPSPSEVFPNESPFRQLNQGVAEQVGLYKKRHPCPAELDLSHDEFELVIRAEIVSSCIERLNDRYESLSPQEADDIWSGFKQCLSQHKKHLLHPTIVTVLELIGSNLRTRIFSEEDQGSLSRAQAELRQEEDRNLLRLLELVRYLVQVRKGMAMGEYAMALKEENDILRGMIAKR